MQGPAFLSQPIIQRLPTLLREVQLGEIRVPRFQRPFVWSAEQRLLLLKSIYQGMPIGSILVWRTKAHSLESYSTLGHLLLEGRPAVGEIKQYLLDGHQRLVTLYAALGEGLVEREPVAESPRPSSSDEGDWPIYFDLDEQAFALKPRRGEPAPSWLPLSILLNPYKLYEFQKQLVEQDLDPVLVNRAENLASQFKDYSIPVVPIVTEDLEMVTESFQRINSAGAKMDQVHMVSALTWKPDFDLNERMKEIKEKLGFFGWKEIEEQWILNTCKAALDLDLQQSEVKAIQEALSKSPAVLEQATDALGKAAEFLASHCSVHGPNALPYSFQIVLLADAIRRATDVTSGQLPADATENLRKWFWVTTYGEYFAGVNSTRLRKALEEARAVAAGRPLQQVDESLRRVAPIRRFDIRAARSRAVVIRMAGLRPKSSDLRDQDGCSLLAEFGKDAAPHLIPTREIPKADERAAASVENRIIAHPRDVTQLRRELLKRDADPELLMSHAIDAEAAQALQEGDISRFFAHRRRKILALEKEFVEQLGLEYATED